MCLSSDSKGGRRLRHEATTSSDITSCHGLVRTHTVQEKPVWKHSAHHPFCSSQTCSLTQTDSRLLPVTVCQSGTSTKLAMDYSTPFSVLNERLRPRHTTSEQLYSSLSRVSSRSYFSYRPSVFSMQPAPRFSVTDAEEDAAQEDSVSDSVEEENCGDVLPGNNSVLISELNIKDENDEDGSFTQSEEKDSSGDLTSEGTDDSSGSVTLSDEGGNSFQRNYLDRTLPDLINSGRPLGRRRTLGHVTNTVNEVIVLDFLHLISMTNCFFQNCRRQVNKLTSLFFRRESAVNFL